MSEISEVKESAEQEESDDEEVRFSNLYCHATTRHHKVIATTVICFVSMVSDSFQGIFSFKPDVNSIQKYYCTTRFLDLLVSEFLYFTIHLQSHRECNNFLCYVLND